MVQREGYFCRFCSTSGHHLLPDDNKTPNLRMFPAQPVALENHVQFFAKVGSTTQGRAVILNM